MEIAMPSPVKDLIALDSVRYKVAAEPVFNVLQSMVLLSMADEVSGLDDWIVQTARQLSAPLMQHHRMIMFGLYSAVVPKRSFDSFETYLDHLKTVDGTALRDQLLDRYLSIPAHEDAPKDLVNLSRDEILVDVETFLAFLYAHFDEESVYENIERQSFQLLNTPEEMKSKIVKHLNRMWQEYFKDEFERRRNMIDETVSAFNEFDLESMNDKQVLNFVTGQVNKKLSNHLKEYEKIVFVPSPHTGPYSRAYFGDDTLWVIFNCRLPEAVPQSASTLSRAQLLVWLTALADDTRLQILAMLKERDELCAQDIITMLETSQSTASRHLRQLSASGYILEHRTEAGKCYRLNDERFEDTIKALHTFIG
jgi:DNA-binding transcriptional ArsR family regulator